MKLVVLERDGVINRWQQGEGIDWQAVTGSPEAIGKLVHRHLRVVVMAYPSTQPAMAQIEQLHDLHAKMMHAVQQAGGGVDAVFMSMADEPGQGPEGKPQLELLREIVARYQLSNSDLIVIGASAGVIQAGIEMGAHTIRVETGPGNASPAASTVQQIPTHRDLAGAVDALLAEQ